GINAQIRSGQGQSGFEGVGFAVPINAAKHSMAQLLSGGKVAYAYLGITTEDLTPSIAKKLGFPVNRGALVDDVQSGTAAGHAGVRAGTRDVHLNGETVRAGGDVIVSLDGHAVRSSGDLVRIVSSSLAPGQKTRVVLVRGTKRRAVTLKLDERPR